MASSSTMFKSLSMTNGCLTSHHTALITTKASYPFISIPSKPIKLTNISSSSFPSRGSLKNKNPSSVIVSVTSDWVPQENAVEEVSAEEEGSLEINDEAGIEAEGDGEVSEEESFAEPPEEAKLFVGNLPYDMDSEKLAGLFDQAGVVEVAEVIYNRDTDQSRGFGFVTMSTVEEAEKAVEMLNRYDVNGRLLTVNKAAPRGSRPERVERGPRDFQSSFRIYVGNLPWQIDDARLEQVFSEHGKVLDARVVFDRESGRSRGFGFVMMGSQTEVDDAIAALDGQSLDGRAIRVNVAEERPRRNSF